MVSIAVLPTWLSALIVLGLPTLYAILFSRYRKVGVSESEEEGRVRFGTDQIARVYGLTLAFVLVTTWGDYRRAQSVVSQEADAVLNMTLAARVLPEAESSRLRLATERYVDALVTKEWPAMAAGNPLPLADRQLYELSEAIVRIRPTTSRDNWAFTSALASVRDLRTLRSDRLLLARSGIPPILWFAIIAGTIVMLTATLANFAGKHRVFGIVVALLLSLVLFISLQLEFPYSGGLRIPPTEIQKALAPPLP